MGSFGSAGMESRPRPLPLSMLAIVCGLAGFGLARASLDVDRAALATRGPAEPRAAVDQVAVDEAAVDETAREDAGVDDSQDEASPDSVDDSSTVATNDAEIDSPPAPAATAIAETGRIQPGRVAYIRCDGLPNVRPSGPCPRDLEVERRVWEAIRALPSCPGLAGRSGDADVRVVFDGRRVSGLGFRELPNALDREAIRGCLEPALSDVRSNSRATRMTASFQFALVR